MRVLITGCPTIHSQKLVAQAMEEAALWEDIIPTEVCNPNWIGVDQAARKWAADNLIPCTDSGHQFHIDPMDIDSAVIIENKLWGNQKALIVFLESLGVKVYTWEV